MNDRTDTALVKSAGHVGIPGPDECVCKRCKGFGLLSRSTAGRYPGAETCPACEGSGVRTALANPTEETKP